MYRSVVILNGLNRKLWNFNRTKWLTITPAMITRLINTSNKNEDHNAKVFYPDYINEKSPKGPETAKEFADVTSQKNWISFGYDEVDQKEDRHLNHALFFSFFSIGMILLSWIIYYRPKPDDDWAIREAFLELEKREKLGLPLIDVNLVDPAKINLPSDEELGDFEIHT